MQSRRYRIIEWNINQATDKYGINIIPDFIINELVKQNPDLVVLTEFRFCKNSDDFLRQAFEERNYDYFPKEATHNTNNGQNEVLIAWRKELFECIQDGQSSVETTWENNHPNCVKVQLEEKINGSNFTVVGLRITMAKRICNDLGRSAKQKALQEQANLRRCQMEYVYKLLEGCSRVLIAGDFNNYRRGSQLKNWNINQLNCMRKEYTVYTPSGQSICEEEKSDKDYEFAEDHFIAKKCVIKDYIYDRGFMNQEKKVYRLGKNFPDWNELNGFPDHAILCGDLWITEELN